MERADNDINVVLNKNQSPGTRGYKTFNSVLQKHRLSELDIEPLGQATVKSLWLQHFKKLLSSIGVKNMSYKEVYDSDIVHEVLGLNYYEFQKLHSQSGQITVVLDPDRFENGEPQTASLDVPSRCQAMFSKATLEHSKLGSYLKQARTWEDLRAVSITVYEGIYFYYHAASVLKSKVIPKELEGMFGGHMTFFEFMLRLEGICEVSYFTDFEAILGHLTTNSNVTPEEAYRKSHHSITLLKFMTKVLEENINIFSDYLRF